MATLYILYGSATGNAEGIAKDLAEKELPSHFSSVVCKPLSDFKKLAAEWEKTPEYGSKHGVIMISSTTGNGDPPENASRFVRFVKKKPAADKKPFQHVAFAVLGLGDTNYSQFCATGKLLDKKMIEFGGERAKKLACADEATGLEDVVEPWLESVVSDVANMCASTPALVEESKPAEEKKSESIAETDHKVEVPENLPSSSESPLYIMYASATGNSEQIAKDLAATYERLLGNPDAFTFFPSVVCCDLNQFKKHMPTWEKENIQGTKHGLIVVASTTGNGDAPENASRFARFIKRKQSVEAQPFKHVNYAVLGLGDTNYDNFCATGKEIDKKLALLGGIRVKPLECADEGTGLLEEVIDPWTVSVLTDLCNACRGGPGQSSGSAPANVPNTATAAPAKEPELEAQPSEQEEKKSESASDIISQNSSCPGIVCLKALLGLQSQDAIPSVSNTMLPSLGASRSSCELFHEDHEPAMESGRFADNATVSSGSSGAMLYTQARPYSSKVAGARYLTNTSTAAARAIMDVVGSDGFTAANDFARAQKVVELVFGLDSNDKTKNERNGKRVIELLLSLPDDYSLEYQPGDTIGLVVPNEASAVAFVLESLRENHGILPTQKVSIDEGYPITVEQAIRENVDLCSVLKSKKILSGLAQFATNEEEATALRFLASKDTDGAAAFQKYVSEQCRSFTDILRDFPSCRSITMEGILGLLPAIPPRYYSISSSPLDEEKKHCLSIAFSVVDYLTPSLKLNGLEYGKRRMHGVATSYLESICAPFILDSTGKLKECPEVKIFPKPTADFRLPSSLSTPIVLIGPGTGIAPFMGFLAHRKAQLMSRKSNGAASSIVEGTWRGGYELDTDHLPVDEKESHGLAPAAEFRKNESVGNVEVFFGCRHEDHDWLFQKEMNALAEDGIITNLHVAFSRGDHKQYVQDLMKSEDASKRLVELVVKQDGAIYICGDGNSMARDVQIALAQIFSSEGGKSMVDRLKAESRLVLDIWS